MPKNAPKFDFFTGGRTLRLPIKRAPFNAIYSHPSFENFIPMPKSVGENLEFPSPPPLRSCARHWQVIFKRKHKLDTPKLNKKIYIVMKIPCLKCQITNYLCIPNINRLKHNMATNSWLGHAKDSENG